MIEVDHLNKYYGPITAIKDLSFRVDKGRDPGALRAKWGGQDHHHAHPQWFYAGE